MSALVRLVAGRVLGCHDLAHLAAGGTPKTMHVVTTQFGHMSPELWFRSDTKGVHVERSIHGTGTVRWAETAALVRPVLTDPVVAAAVADGCAAWGRYCHSVTLRFRRSTATQDERERQLRAVGYAAMASAKAAVWAAVDGATVRQLDLFGAAS